MSVGHPRDVEQETECRLELRLEIPKTRKQPIMSALLEPSRDAQRFRGGSKDAETPSHAHGSQELW